MAISAHGKEIMRTPRLNREAFVVQSEGNVSVKWGVPEERRQRFFHDGEHQVQLAQ